MRISRREFVILSTSAAAYLIASQGKAQPLRRRREIRSLSSAEVATLAAGVAAMQSLARDNPLSWEFQRAVHGLSLASDSGVSDPPNVGPYWRQCNHHTDHFFDWHRWELLYWEEICRQLCGNAAFTLPYWDYFTNAYLPDAFRAPAAGTTNVLFHRRNAALNNGSAQLSGISPSGMQETAFLDFQYFFEFDPHDAVHGFIGFDMGSTLTAALDPIFYLHHANVDRYWAKWIKQGGGRANPSGNWATRSYNFQTVSGPVTKTSGGSGTTEGLGYTYDLITPTDILKTEQILKLLQSLKSQYRFPKPKPVPGPGPDPGPWRMVGTLAGIALDGHPTVVPVPTPPGGSSALREFSKAKGIDLALVLDDVKATEMTKQGGYIYQVYLVPSGKSLSDGTVDAAVQVGSFSAFTVSAAQHHEKEGHAATPRIAFKLNERARALMSKSAGGDPSFVFVRRGLLSDGHEIQTDVDATFFTIEGISLQSLKRPAP
jgi:tyrosinase